MAQPRGLSLPEGARVLGLRHALARADEARVPAAAAPEPIPA